MGYCNSKLVVPIVSRSHILEKIIIWQKPYWLMRAYNMSYFGHNIVCRIFLVNAYEKLFYLYLIAFACNAKNFAVAFRVVFFSSTFLPSVLDRLAYVFAYNLIFATNSACDQDCICFLEHTGKYFVGYTFTVTGDACDPWHDMCFGEELLMVELIGTIKVFHDVNPALHTITTIHHKTRVLLKATNVFQCKVNLIHGRTAANSEIRWKMTEDSFKNVKDTHGRVILLVKLQASAFFKLYKWY